MSPDSGGRVAAPLVAASRPSPLALQQTRTVMSALAVSGLPSTLLEISTRGDRESDRSLEAIGGDGIFVKELEVALRAGRADYAVHSCKDLPSTLASDMRIAAVGPREDPRDAFCSERFASLEALPAGARVGTSSPRRSAQLLARHPGLQILTIRGNVGTRLRKLREGQFDAIVLALAGLRRIGAAATYVVPIDPQVMLPAAGQGALAVECRAADASLAARIAAAYEEAECALAVAAERAFLREMLGGCRMPLGALAEKRDGKMHIEAALFAVDGSGAVRVRQAANVTTLADAEKLGASAAREILASMGDGR